MSYPLMLHPLVIEDDVKTKDGYEAIFDILSREFDPSLPFRMAHPCFAFSHEQAVGHLESSKIFHVVILDLRLPAKQGMPALEDQDLGLDLLERCIDRDRYPIPALLVISGHIGGTNQLKIQDTLRDRFCFGRLLAKGDAFLEGHIRNGCKEALRYSSVGIHLRDSGEELYPTLSPRDEDLLRRSILQQSGAIGADLNWWSAKRSPEGGAGAAGNPWTKVLTGRYLLDDGGGASRPKFFKLLAASDSYSVIESARRIEQKLTHIKITSTVLSRSTGLIVSEKVGAKVERSRPLGEAFAEIHRGAAFKIAGQIVEQVEQLGELLDDNVPLQSILWQAHDKEVLRTQWNGIQPRLPAGVPTLDPVAVFSELHQSDQSIWLRERSLVHGDLHMNNVALDFSETSTDAYIFDPGVMTRSAAGRDLAVLEVSVLLHQPLDLETLIQVCSVIYDVSKPLDETSYESFSQPLAQNIIEFVRGLRAGVKSWNPAAVYALLVFDFALIQLGGLSFGTSANRIEDPSAAGVVAAFAAEWYTRLATGAGATQA